jgi:adenosine kinase
MGEKEVLEQAGTLIVTKGEKGSSIITKSGQADVPAVAPTREADPTGVGDAFRGGLLKGFAIGLPAAEAAKIGSVAATYCLEHLGGTNHSYTFEEFKKRYEKHFGPLKG